MRTCSRRAPRRRALGADANRPPAGELRVRVYIHEYVDIIGHNRARYMQHMTANWGPIGQDERGQLCVGVWATVGSTGRWPQVVNLWEYPGWEALGRNFEVEQVGAGLQDPALSEWWAAAAGMRSGGDDRIMEAADWSSGIEEILAREQTGSALYTHDHVMCVAGRAGSLLDELAEEAARLRAEGRPMIGLRRALVRDDEVVVIRGWPSWDEWARHEEARVDERHSVAGVGVVARTRILLVDAPLSPLRTGRQPSRADRVNPLLPSET